MMDRHLNPMEEPSKSGYKSAAAPILCGLIVLYFVFPYAFLWPVVMIHGKHTMPAAWVRAFFLPVTYLSRKVPAYRAMLLAEGRWTGLG